MSWSMGAIIGGLCGVGVTVLTGGVGGIVLAAAAATSASLAGATTGAVLGAVVGGAASNSGGAATAAAAATIIASRQTQSTLAAVAGPLAKGLAKSFYDNVLRDAVEDIPPGAIISCDIYCVEHSGVFIGDNKIVHLNGDGLVEAVSPESFLDRLDGLNNALSIYVACRGDSAMGSRDTAQYARDRIGERLDYNMFLNNCHRFTIDCILCGGEPDVWPTTSMSGLKRTVRETYGADSWRVWRHDAARHGA